MRQVFQTICFCVDLLYEDQGVEFKEENAMVSGKTSLRRTSMLVVLACLVLLPAGVWAGGVEEKKEPALAAAPAPAPEPAKPAINCMDCHASTGPKYPLFGAKLGYEVSGHKKLGDARYANAGGCQRCHTNEGYIEYVQMGFDTKKYDAFAVPPTPSGGTAPAQPFIAYPSQPGCFSCHDPHTTGDFVLRTQTVDKVTKAVTNQKITLYNGVVYDGGTGNQCASCHQARGNVMTATASLKGIISSRGTSHHGPEADMLVGTNGYEFAGKTYGSSPHSKVIENTCVTCHMEQPSARYGFSPEVGGHAFTVVGEVHEAPVGNLNNCLACHKDMKSIAAKKYINTAITTLRDSVYFTIKAKADYDLDGTVEFVQQEVQGLMDRLVNTKGTGVMQTMANPMFKPDGTSVASKVAYTTDQLGAYANLLYVIEDKSIGVHNATYTVQLLMDSIQAIDPKFDVSNRP
jgi:cytochrome c553